MKKTHSIKTVVAIGIGAAIFVVLSRFASIPSGIPNTSLETAYAVLALIAVLYGPLAGFATGLIGHFLKDVLIFGSPWFSWIIASAMIGLVLGLSIVAPTLDVLIYAEPADKVYLQGMVAGCANMLTVGILGSLLVNAYAKTRIKKGSLVMED